jgi:hypothetical protein
MPILPELRLRDQTGRTLEGEYSSADNVITKDEVAQLLKKHRLLIEDKYMFEEDVIA